MTQDNKGHGQTPTIAFFLPTAHSAMPLSPLHTALSEQLQSLQAELQLQGLWSATAPSPEAMASAMPFMYDTLELHQWLQWVFVPRLLALLDCGASLPRPSHVQPLAEHEWQARPEIDSRRLLSLLQTIDELLNQEPSSAAAGPLH